MWRRMFLLGSVIAGLLLGAVSGAAPQQGARGWVLSGFFSLGERRDYVSLAPPSGGAARWWPIGASVEGWRLVAFDRQRGQLTLENAAGERLAIPLRAETVGQVALRPLTEMERGHAARERVRLPRPSGPQVASSPELRRSAEIVDVFPALDSAPSADGLDWEWIESEDNPMRRVATLPSTAESAHWAKLSPAARADLVELYRQCGWAIRVFVRGNGLVAASISRLERPTGNRTGASAEAAPERR